MADDKELKNQGFTPATVRDHDSLPEIKNAAPAKPMTPAELPVPSTPLAQAVTKYAQEKLQEQTFNHSMRVFYFGQAMRKQYFPQWTFSDETWLLSCLLHDIGTTDENLHATLMSFEFYGGIVALNELERQGSSQAQRESVAEAIFRHQDLGKVGTITALGQLLQLATVFDNMGTHPHLVHQETIKSVVVAAPRKGWSQCFSKTIRLENGLKPWAHTTALGEEDFPQGVAENKLMEPFDSL